MNYRVIANDGLPRILKTGAAVGPDVFGDLRAARVALRELVEAEIKTLRHCRDVAVATRDGDLLIEDKPEPDIDIPPAPGEGDLRDIPAFMRRT